MTIQVLILISCINIPLYLIANAVYQAYFSPLTQFHGPIWCAISRLPLSWHTINGNRLTWTHQLHQRYGETVRVAPDELSFINEQSWRDIYGRSKSCPSGLEKDQKFYMAFQGVDGPSLLNANADIHSIIRPILSSFFAENNLREREPLFQKHVHRLIEWLSRCSANKDKVNLQTAFNCLGFDVMSDLIFKNSLNMLLDETYNPWLIRVFANVKAMAVQSVLGYYPLLSKFIRWILPKSIHDLEIEHYAFINHLVDERVASGPKHDEPDVWSCAEDAARKKNRQILSDSEVRANAALFLVAGSETSAAAMVGVTYLLLTNPVCMKRLKQELGQRFPKASDISLAAVAELPYLNACIQEGLRIYPPSPTGLPRRTPLSGAAICGYWIPGNTAVSTSHYSAYHSPINFYRPNDFVPERWLATVPLEFHNDRKQVLQPFSYGQRNCLGQAMALHEIRLALATVLRRFDVSLCEESKNWIQHKNYILWEKPPLMVNVVEE